MCACWCCREVPSHDCRLLWSCGEGSLCLGLVWPEVAAAFPLGVLHPRWLYRGLSLQPCVPALPAARAVNTCQARGETPCISVYVSLLKWLQNCSKGKLIPFQEGEEVMCKWEKGGSSTATGPFPAPLTPTLCA